jgi:NHL repeat-containing protein
VVATGVPRPLGVVVDGSTLVVLSPGRSGNAAGEVYRVDLAGELPVDLSREPGVEIPFDGSRASLGSLAREPRSHDLYVGEENGARIHRLGADGHPTLYATGLRRLGGGGTLGFDDQGRMIVLDYADPRLSPDEETHGLSGLEQFRDEDYRGPLLFRLTMDATIPLPRRLSTLAPFFPRAWGGRQGGAGLPRLVSVLPTPDGDVLVLSSRGRMFHVTADARPGSAKPPTGDRSTASPALRLHAVLPPGQYDRTTMAAGRGGAVFVGGGFHVGAVFRVAGSGAVSVVARDLADPEGIALDGQGRLYVAESSLHRIVRFHVGG